MNQELKLCIKYFQQIRELDGRFLSVDMINHFLPEVQEFRCTKNWDGTYKRGCCGIMKALKFNYGIKYNRILEYLQQEILRRL